MKIAHLAVLGLAGTLGASVAMADADGVAAIEGFHNNEFRPFIGMAAQPAEDTAAYRGVTGAYSCANLAAGGSRVIRYPFTVPDARALQFVRVWGFKTTGTADTTMLVRRSCMTGIEVNPTTVTLADTTVTSTTGAFTAVLSLGTELPLNVDCRYWVEVEFGSSAQACGSGTQDLRIDRVRVQSLLGDRVFRGNFRQYTP